MPRVNEPQVRATHYEVTAVPDNAVNRSLYVVHVAYHGRGRWVVYREAGSRTDLLCLAADGTWSVPEDPSWFGAPDYGLEEALTLARRAAASLSPEGEDAPSCPA